MAFNRLKFYSDEQVAKAVVDALLRRGIDMLRAQETGLTGASDLEHLRFAEREGRVVFTHDIDFLRLHKEGISHCGIVYAPQRTPIRKIVQGLMLIFEVLTPDEMKNHIEFI